LIYNETPSVTTWEELQTAMQTAEDGDKIKISATITIPSGAVLGLTDKVITLQKNNSIGKFVIPFSSEQDFAEIQNIIFDGTCLQVMSNTTFTRCTFKNCTSDFSVKTLAGTINFSYCTFDDNSASHLMVTDGSAVNLNYCTFTDGHAEYSGGAVTCNGTSSCTISNSTIKNNSAGMNGGGLCGTGQFTCINSKIFNNSAGDYGSDIYCLNITIEKDIEDLQTIYSGEEFRVLGWIDQETSEGDESFTSMKLNYTTEPESDDPQEPEPQNPEEPEEPSEDDPEIPSEEPQNPPESEDPEPDDGNGQGTEENPSESNSEPSVINNYYYSSTERIYYQTEPKKEDTKNTQTEEVKESETKPSENPEQKTAEDPEPVKQNDQGFQKSNDPVVIYVQTPLQQTQSKDPDPESDQIQKSSTDLIESSGSDDPVILNLEGLSCTIQKGVDCTIQIKGDAYSVTFDKGFAGSEDQTERNMPDLDWYEIAKIGLILTIGAGVLFSLNKSPKGKEKPFRNDSGRSDDE